MTEVRGFQLPDEDLQGIDWIFQTFYSNGPQIQYTANFGGTSNHPTYADLMTSTDAAGLSRSFLATSESFSFLKGLNTRNLVVPVVGDFAGSKALRGIGRYLADKQTIVGAFYL